MFIEYVMTSELAIVFSELLFLMGVAHEIIDFTDLKKHTSWSRSPTLLWVRIATLQSLGVPI